MYLYYDPFGHIPQLDLFFIYLKKNHYMPHLTWTLLDFTKVHDFLSHQYFNFIILRLHATLIHPNQIIIFLRQNWLISFFTLFKNIFHCFKYSKIQRFNYLILINNLQHVLNNFHDLIPLLIIMIGS